jgi:hypothetical protein
MVARVYTLQALWTYGPWLESVSQRHDGWSSPTGKAVLKQEFSYLAVGTRGAHVAAMLEIGRPDLDWTLSTKGMGYRANV